MHPPLVPHSQCSLRENPKFLQNFKSKNYILKSNFSLIFLFTISHCNSGLAFQSKNYYITSQNCMYFKWEKSQNLRRKCKWALWMRHLALFVQSMDNCSQRECTFIQIISYPFRECNQELYKLNKKLVLIETVKT
jgi:hypothetical protein